MLISNKAEQTAIIDNKNQIIIDSLSQAIQYIDVKTAMALLDYSRVGTLKVLRRLADMKIVKEHEVLIVNRKIKIFGLTAIGREISSQELKPWSIKNFKAVTFNHDMLLHFLINDLKKMVVNEIGNHSFDQSFIVKNGKQTRRPDFSYRLNNKIYPFELELTYKSKSRYHKIFSIYRNYYEKYKVAPTWVFTNENEAKRFYKLGREINSRYSDSIMDVFFWSPQQGFELMGEKSVNQFHQNKPSRKIKTNSEIKNTITELKDEIESLEDWSQTLEFRNREANNKLKKMTEQKDKTIKNLVDANKSYKRHNQFFIAVAILAIMTALYSIYFKPI